MLDLKSVLNDEQILPVLETEGPVLVFAGAGSGKTRVLTYRIAHMILDKKIKSENILAITFTNKAATTMKERVAQLAPVNELTISTFHSFCATQLRQLVDWLPNYNKNFSIYDDDDSKKVFIEIVKEEFKQIDTSDSQGQEKLKKLILLIREKVSQAKNLGMEPGEYGLFLQEKGSYKQSTINSIINIYNNYQQKLQHNNAMDFDDLLFNFYILLKKNNQLKEALQQKYKYILVDEYQDTNAVQNKIIIELAGEDQNVFAVGDDDQSIYSWRGADITNIIDFKKAFPNVKTYKLETNYRSTKQILDVANNIIKNNQQRVDKTLQTRNNGGVRVEVKTLSDDYEEVEYVADQIQLLHSNNIFQYSDFAILMRNNYLSQKLETEFVRRRIPYVFFGGYKFFHRTEIKTAIAIFQYVTNPDDDNNILKIINQYPGVGDKTVLSIIEVAQQNNKKLHEIFYDYQNYDFSPRVKKIMDNLSEYFSGLTEAYKRDQVYFLENFVNITKITILLKVQDSIELNSKLQNIEELASNFKNSYIEGTSIIESMQKIALTSETDVNTDGDNVVISTIHSAKGLEFGCVFLIAFEERILPSGKALDSSNSGQLEEERRLAYVAVTRAKDRLYITRTNRRMYGGNYGFALASRFLEETGLIKKEPSFSNIRYNDEQMQNDAYYERFIDNTPSKSFDNAMEYEKQRKIIAAKDISKYQVNQLIEHPTFGNGKIIKIDGGIASIVFDKHGEKQISLKHIDLKIRG